MAAGRRSSSGGAGTLGVGLALVLAGLAGCSQQGAEGGGYDPAMRYPLRKDPIVVALPPTDPAALAPAGKLDESIAGLDALGGKTLDPRRLTDRQKIELTASLETLFGTPAAPLAGPDAGDPNLSPGHLADGSRVYRRLCNQCHGLSGDGNGPAGTWVYPHPRDFRPGVYKVAHGGGKPDLETLVRVIRHGVPASSMQPFDLIAGSDLRAAAAYTVHLSLRGEVEMRVIRSLLGEETDETPADVETACREELTRVRRDWHTAGTSAPPPAMQAATRPEVTDPESIRRGHQLFVGEAGCTKCHQDYGRTEFFKYSIWGTPVRVPDLTLGEFRWGKDPVDLTDRVRHGIPASGMPANPFLTEGQVEDLVNFVREVGYPQRLPVDVRQTVYPARQ